MSVSVDIFYLPNSGYFDKTGVFQQPRLLATVIQFRTDRRTTGAGFSASTAGLFLGPDS
jgi:hypothetical protein